MISLFLIDIVTAPYGELTYYQQLSIGMYPPYTTIIGIGNTHYSHVSLFYLKVQDVLKCLISDAFLQIFLVKTHRFVNSLTSNLQTQKMLLGRLHQLKIPKVSVRNTNICTRSTEEICWGLSENWTLPSTILDEVSTRVYQEGLQHFVKKNAVFSFNNTSNHHL